jgi:hypothetical protein
MRLRFAKIGFWLMLALMHPQMPLLGREAHGAEVVPSFAEEVRPIFETFCYRCHGEEKMEGNLKLTPYQTDEEAKEDLEVWDRVLKRLLPHEMPPDGAKQPVMAQHRLVLRWLESLPLSHPCEEIASDQSERFYKGHVMSRRLNRAEYANALRDLFGVEFDVLNSLPADGAGGEGFDTTGSTLFTSTILLEKYLDVAEHVVTTILPDELPAGAPANVAEARGRVLFVLPSESLSPRVAAEKIIARYARRAFRRTPTPEEMASLLIPFDRQQTAGHGFLAGLRNSLAAMLISPHFLFLAEPEPAQVGVYQLDDMRLAARLASFLWSSIPDEELLSAAEQGRLADADALRAQVRRMLHDPRAKALGDNFALQWLSLTNLGATIRPAKERFPEFDDELCRCMKQEASELLVYIIREDRPLTELLNASYSLLNERLARHYRIDNVQGSSFRKVELPADQRGGVLTLAGVLTATSYPLRTSPVLRGRWVMESVLGERIPPPPPNVPTLPPQDPAPGEVSLRAQLERHRGQAECAACHKKMDPIGFGLENFDPLGRWRGDDESSARDTMGELPTGEKFAGPAELKAILLAQKERFLRHFVRKLLGYALGREINKFDQCAVDDTLKELAEHEDRASIVFTELVVSFPFRHRFSRQ